jgi:hypothetical protein
MSCNNTPVEKKPSNASLVVHDQPTLWEHFVLHKASEKKVMLFDLDIEHKTFKANKSRKKKRSMSDAPDAATTLAATERQRANSAPAVPSNINPATTNTTTETTKGNPPKPYRPTLDPILQSFSTQTTSNTTSFATSFDSVTLDSAHSITFGPNELYALLPATFREDTERQAALVKVRPTEGMTMKRRLLAEDALPVGDEQLMMSGALERGDVTCEVCAARERAMGGLEEAGIVAL